MRLRVSIGSNKDDLQTAWVNVEDKPTEIDTKYWVGRVLVRVKDFDGYTPDGTPPMTESEYFEGRNRRFHIQAEGRFKKAYNGDQIWFGTQFDHMIGNFPETLFNAGMRIAKYIDPAVFYDKNSNTPYIMSPYLACVNTLSAWPAPHRSRDAVLALENGNAMTESDDEHEEDEVPREEVQHSKKSVPPTPIRYWSFQGFREDETSNTLQRKPTRESLILEEQSNQGIDAAREGSVRSQSTKYDDDRMVTAEHPTHRLALTRLGSYDRETGPQRNSVLSARNTLGTFPEALSEEEDSDQDGNESFYTAAEYIFEDVVQPDGTVVPVKKPKKGLSVKKVRKSLHIPSAKTVQKNMRGLSIKRKDKGDKKLESPAPELERSEGARGSLDAPVTRKSLDLMRPFRFGHHDKDKDSAPTRKSMQIDRDHSSTVVPIPKSRVSISDERDFSSRTLPQKDILPPARSATIETYSRPSSHSIQASQSSSITAVRSDRVSEHSSTTAVSHPVQQSNLKLQQPLNARTDSTVTSSTVEAPSIAMQSLQSIENTKVPSTERREANPTSSLASGPTTTPASSLNTGSLPSSSRNPSTTGQTEIRGDALASSVDPDDGLSHKLDRELGPWRFSNPKIEPIEDTAFIFGDTSHSVKDRRKHFAKSTSNREEFEFDPDIVYCMSFFLPYMNFNTFDLKLGPLGANLHKYVDDQPVRYMARCADRPEEVFFMVEFSLE